MVKITFLMTQYQHAHIHFFWVAIYTAVRNENFQLFFIFSLLCRFFKINLSTCLNIFSRVCQNFLFPSVHSKTQMLTMEMAVGPAHEILVLIAEVSRASLQTHQSLSCPHTQSMEVHVEGVVLECLFPLRLLCQKTFWHSRRNGNRHFGTVDIMGIDILAPTHVEVGPDKKNF